MRRLVVLLAWLLAAPVVHAEEGVWLVVDSTAYRPFGALTSLPYQEVQADGKVRRWVDQERTGGAVIVPLVIGPIIGVYHYDPVPGWRLEAMQPISDPMTRDGRLRLRLEEVTRTVLAERGLSTRIIAETVEPGRGHLRQLGDRGGEAALVIQRDGPSMLQLSWDDRQLLLTVKVRRFEPSRTPAQPERERGMRQLRFIGAPLAGDAPLERWAADDAALFLASAERAWAKLLAESLEAEPDLPKAGRGETVRLQVGGRGQTFKGHLWKQEDGFAYVVTRDGAINLIELGE